MFCKYFILHVTTVLFVNSQLVYRSHKNGKQQTIEHWIQRITFAAETNATRVQSRLCRHTHRRLAPQYLLRLLSNAAAKVINKEIKEKFRQFAKMLERQSFWWEAFALVYCRVA